MPIAMPQAILTTLSYNKGSGWNSVGSAINQ